MHNHSQEIKFESKHPKNWIWVTIALTAYIYLQILIILSLHFYWVFIDDFNLILILHTKQKLLIS